MTLAEVPTMPPAMTAEETLALALDWAALGVPVFPVALSWDQAKYGGVGGIDKAPLTPHGHLDASTDPERVRALWSGARLPMASAWGVGGTLGPAGYVVLDGDVKGGRSGPRTLQRLEATHGEFARYRYRSASGGLNVVCRKPPGARFGNHAPPAWEGIDVRADAGWIVLPGVRSPWGSWVEEYGELADAIELPAAMAEQLRQAADYRQPAGAAEVNEFVRSRSQRPSSPSARAAFDQRLARFDEAAAGSRHGGLLEVVGWVVGMRALNMAEALDEVIAAWRRLVAGEGRDGEALEVIQWVVAQQLETEERERSAHTPDVRPLPSPDTNRPDGQPAAWSTPPDPEHYASWRPVDLRPALDGELERPAPAILRRDDGAALIYPGQINGIHGADGIGKSWTFAVAAMQEMQSGRHVVWLDFEDPDAATIVGRLEALGVSAEVTLRHLHYLSPGVEADEHAVGMVVELVESVGASLVVIDSVGEAFGLEGLNENNDAEVTPWLRRVARRLADTGAAVGLVDHSTKSTENPLFPSGSKRKRAAITGAQYMVEATRPLTKEHGGQLRLTCGKDRHGNYRRGEAVALIDFTMYPDGGMTVHITRPVGNGEAADVQMFLAAESAVAAAYELGEPVSQRVLVGSMKVKASTEAKRAGIEYAVMQGAIEESPGPRNARIYRYLQPLGMPT